MPKSGIPAVTFDLLDASIPAEFAEWQACPDRVRYRSYREPSSTDPVLWKRHTPPEWAFALQWSEFRYSDVKNTAELNEIVGSDSPGLYIFYIRPDRSLNRFPQFALYVGISNKGNSQRPLRERLKDYLPARIASKRKRQHIDRMLRLYFGVLWVTYSFSDKPSAELEALEETLHGFLFPRYARRDFPVDIKSQQKAFGEI